LDDLIPRARTSRDIRPVLNEQPIVPLDGVIELQGEEILGIGELLDDER
jgi:hypothetical protein